MKFQNQELFEIFLHVQCIHGSPGKQETSEAKKVQIKHLKGC